MRSRLMQYCSGPPMQNHSGVDKPLYLAIGTGEEISVLGTDVGTVWISDVKVSD